ncbi:unnamed protein product [Vicia faba]|uniref:S1 motif domain-containing protein n=1 Tax=Vicia faba TaxID=3906 RepID=A0AAV1B7F7_VICFA|nr:unnamed protein product [Vicia faba]
MFALNITDIKTFELKLKFGFGLHGRVHITEVHDANDLENPFSGYKIGQTVTARIVSKPNDADSSRNGSRWELSVRPEMMKYKERVLGLILVSPICKGPSWTEWIYNKVLMNLLYFYGMCGLLKECLLQRYFSKELRCSIEGSESEVILTCQRVHSLFCFVCVKFIMLNIFVAGTDTSTYTLEWAMAELMHNPEIMSKVQNELEQVVGKGIPVEETDIAKLPYMQAVIKETFRVHPPVPLLLPRKAETDVEIGDYIIPKDAQVLVNAWVIGRDPSKWENPNAFVPERFFNSEIDFKGHHFELIPFGSGRRICPGLPLAIRMLPLMLGSLVNCFDWRLEDGLNVDDLNKEDEYGITLEKSQPVRIVPIKLTKQ